MNKGEILLHDPRAIGLMVEQGNIKLFPFQTKGWMSGISMDLNFRHYRAQGKSGDSMTLLSAELQIPGPGSGAMPDYTGRIEGWDYYKTDGTTDVYKPSACQFLPDHTDYTTFAWTDAYDEEYPYFYYGWGLRTIHVTDIGYNKWTNTAHLGLNYPVPDMFRPGFEEAPPAKELLRLMQPYIPEGQWRFRVEVSPFKVDSGVTAPTSISIIVKQGRKRFYRGSLDFVSVTDYLVGEDDGDLSGVAWANVMDPGELVLLSGNGIGKRFEVIGVHKTDDDPLPGLPPNTWIIRTKAGDSPYMAGAQVGDKYMLTSSFFDSVYVPFKYYQDYLPGHYPQATYEEVFEPKY